MPQNLCGIGRDGNVGMPAPIFDRWNYGDYGNRDDGGSLPIEMLLERNRLKDRMTDPHSPDKVVQSRDHVKGS
ncbi:MAG: hypothetical protein WC729_18120 [Sphingomonas sp.]|jgi:hypothetical protein|uniref:hypothetical protein n=1 Tax=Sphingomonas sp. TaxID=28214 RepID=UPI003565960C